MKLRWLALLWWVALTLPGCATQNLDSYRPKDQDEALVVSMLMKIPNGVKDRSLEMIMQPYAEDVYVGNFQKYLGVAGPQAPLSISKAELRSVYAQVFRASKEVTMTVRDFRLTVSGDRAVAEAITELFFKLEAGRKERRDDTYRNDVTWRLRRTPAGWKIQEEIWQ